MVKVMENHIKCMILGGTTHNFRKPPGDGIPSKSHLLFLKQRYIEGDQIRQGHAERLLG